MGITDDSGKSGLILAQNEPFDLRVTNTLNEPTVIHWHCLTRPFQHDGSNVSKDPIQPGGTHDNRFDLTRGGTNWMHSHFGLQEASLLAAPLIVQSAEDLAADRQDVTIILHDFSFTPPTEIFARLQSGAISHVRSGMAAMNMGMMRTGQGSMAGMDHSGMDMYGHMTMDLNDVAFDAFLANDRDLSDPEIVQVDENSAVRFRVVNAASRAISGLIWASYLAA